MPGSTRSELHRRPIPGRTTIVLSRNPDFHPPRGAFRAASLTGALSLAGRLPGHVVWIAGGRGVYAEALLLAHRLYLTRVKGKVAGDVRFPSEWRRYFRRQTGRREQADCTFLTFSPH